MIKSKYRVGYCCINLSIPSKFKTAKLGWCKNNPDTYEAKLWALYEYNFKELCRVINWNIENGIFLYRISSDLNPLADHKLGEKIFSIWLKSSKYLVEARETIKKYLALGGRVACHPSQFVSLGSENPVIRSNSITNLEYHGKIFDELGLPRSHFALINIHASGGKDPLPRLKYYYKSLDSLSPSVSSRITFETEDKGFWGAQNLRQYFPDITLVLDTLHHKINNFNITQGYAFEICSETWGDVTQLIHHSEGRESPLDRKHSDYVKTLPDLPADIEIEAKAKDLAVLKIYND